jgi:hypothetical protein
VLVRSLNPPGNGLTFMAAKHPTLAATTLWAEQTPLLKTLFERHGVFGALWFTVGLTAEATWRPSSSPSGGSI